MVLYSKDINYQDLKSRLYQGNRDRIGAEIYNLIINNSYKITSKNLNEGIIEDLDSLDCVELGLIIEDRFDIEFPDEVVEKLFLHDSYILRKRVSIDRIIDYLISLI